MRQEAPGVREGSVEAVHQFRVASRRLRAALIVFAPYLNPDTTAVLEAHAKSVTKGLGRPRELDVLIAMLEEWRRDYHPPWNFAAGHAAGVLRTEREGLQAQCAEAAAVVDDAAFTAPVATRSEAPCLCTHMPDVLREHYDEARSAYKGWRDTGEAKDLHEVRKYLKKLRYACEHFAPFYGKKLARFIDSLRSVQDDLGEWQDRRILCKTLDELEAGAPYRAAQGFPELVRDAEMEAEVAARAVRKSARDLLGKKARKEAHKIFDAPKRACCVKMSNEKE